MARPLKTGLDYFSLDCHMDDKVKLVQAEFGLKGFAIVIKLYQKIYGEEGYFAKWTQDVRLLFAVENNVSESLVCEVVNACIKRGIFDQELYEQFSVLTSVGVQKMYFGASQRRKGKKLQNEYILLSAFKNTVNDNSNQDNDCNNSINGVNNTQSKEYVDMIDKFEDTLCKTLSPRNIDVVLDLCSLYDANLITLALDQAKKKKADNIRYIETILNNWHEKGISNIADAQKQIASFESRKDKDKRKIETLDEYITI